jgi:hypothetical protein
VVFAQFGFRDLGVLLENMDLPMNQLIEFLDYARLAYLHMRHPPVG